ncbi:hypothetical protein [Geobacillus thermodenitrificans]|jgi:hypothetical protein|uniref:DUF4878 domain-containing protein n=1 Tax=Geobacillus thermodenitrificans (strain NG80-2) TaxID=420246 RepID=A4ITA0_GEOTN|nr:hypothetical protein [Geobacillus thermodenitrificans]ABO68554.1 Conserved hypothetical protein [Geobacillus thermodenitrificans NG80-2]MED3905417.1 hypothetical protein [Geobacillus thermodenitrificans]
MVPRYRQKTISARTGVTILTAVALLAVVLSLFLSNERHEAKQVVKAFYRYEQAGDFGSSWELFHPQMKKKFPKDVYIQRRAHVFMQDFDVETFEYRLDEAEHLASWSMSGEHKPLQDVYRIRVIQTFHSTFGVFELHQDVFVAKENGKWSILFPYDSS